MKSVPSGGEIMKPSLSAILFSLLILFSWTAHAAVIRVPADEPTIQAGIDAAVDGDLILVSQGLYLERIQIVGKAVTVRSDGDGLPWTYDVDPEGTIIDGGYAGVVVSFFGIGEDASVLDGFTITHGTGFDAPGSAETLGGGIYCSDGSPFILHCTITGNTATWGGGLFFSSSSAMILDCEIVSNSAKWGGGLSCELTDLRIEGSTIEMNTAESGGGGGVIFNGGSPTITDCTVSDNQATPDGFGGGIYCYSSSPTIDNCTISGNQINPYGTGAGIYCHEGSPTIVNSTISGNGVSYPGSIGSGIYLYASSPTISGCVIRENDECGIYSTTGSTLTIADCTISDNGYRGIYCSSSQTSITGCTVKDNNDGGIRCSGSSAVCTIEGCTVSGNAAGYDDGGGIEFAYNSTGTVTDSLIFDNSAGDGGGVACGGVSTALTNCMIFANSASYKGGGIYWVGSNHTVTHCTIANNAAYSDTEGGGGVYCATSSIPVVTNSILWDNWSLDGSQISGGTIDLTYSDVQVDTPDAVWPGEGNINTWPIFRDGLYLTTDSPCIDAGTDAGVYSDIEGDPRPFGEGFDMGADESTLVCADGDGDGYDDAGCGGSDCDDTDDAVSLGADEDCHNGIDDDCDGTIDGQDDECPIAIHVPGDYGTIQGAIDAGTDGDTILVAPGTYVENIDYLGKSITVRSDMDGDPATEDVSPETTIIDGSGSGPVVTFSDMEGSGTVLAGFTITGGQSERGGGVYCSQYTSALISQCIITDNRAEKYGGGIYGLDVSACIVDCVISGNHADTYDGGGISIHAWHGASIESCTISNNSAHYDGGGLSLYVPSASSALVTNCTFAGNYSGYNGGGIHSWGDGLVVLENSLIAENEAENFGGGISVGDYSYSGFMEVMNCTLAGNTAWKYGGGGLYGYYGTLTVANSILWDNSAMDGPEIKLNRSSAVVRYSDIQGGQGPVHLYESDLDWQEGNIDADPFFVGAGDYRLSEGSPCIDAGDPDPTFDDVCFPPSEGTERNDMGAYGGLKACGWILCFDGDGDGYESSTCGGDDCDDGDPAIHPGAPEVCNGIDDDCDGTADEDFDLDGDGFGPCSLPAPDCDDTAPETYPGAPEICDGFDNDCDGSIPDEELDADGDGFLACRDDCDDSDPEVHPLHEEVPDNDKDDNCNGEIDETWATIWVPEGQPTIQAGIDAAAAGDVVMVAPGTYSAPIVFNGEAITVRSAWGPEVTVIDGNGAGAAVIFVGDKEEQEEQETLLEGFTIQNGTGEYVSAADGFFGGGVFCGVGISPAIVRCTIAGNTADYGGGIFCGEGSVLRVEGCSIEWNQSEVGGGILCENSSPVIIGCEISNNTAYQDGGGIGSIGGAAPRIDDCTLSENSASHGGAVYCAEGSMVEVESSTLSDNGAVSGAGIYCIDASTQLMSCELSGNVAESDGGAIACLGAALLSLESCTLADNSAEWGGAILYDGPVDSTLQASTFSMNYAASGGGAIICRLDASPLIQDCRFSKNSSFIGGALHCIDQASPSIVACTFEENEVLESGASGGALGCAGQASPIVTDCAFSENVARQDGGAVYCREDATPTIQVSLFRANRTIRGSGGAVYCDEVTSAMIDRCTFEKNDADDYGGALYFERRTKREVPPSVVVNCTFQGNVAYVGGGALSCRYDSTGVIANCTFSGNLAMYDGGALSMEGDAVWSVVNSILWGNHAGTGPEIYLDYHPYLSVAWSDVQGGEAAAYVSSGSTLYWQNGNIDADPLLVGKEDLHLSFGSPCIDAASPMEIDFDIDGDSRPQGEVFDMGSDEYPAGCHDRDGDGFGDPACGGHDCDDAAPAVNPGMEEDCENGIDDDCDGAVDGADPACMTLHVPGDHPTIQEALEAAGDGALVLVAPGTYYEKEIEFFGKEVTLRSEEGAEATVIDGDHEGRVMQFIYFETSKTVVDGFTLRKGDPSYSSYQDDGGGIYCRYSSPVIKNCRIIENITEDCGGGIYCYSGSPTIENCFISGNEVYSGGGICCSRSSPTIASCVISSNEARDGGGIFCYSGSPIVVDCVISGHVVTYGGGIYCHYDSSPKIINTVISENEARRGGALYCYNEASPELLYCTVSGNYATEIGGAVYSFEAAPIITNSILWGDWAKQGAEIGIKLYDDPSTLDVRYSDVQGGESAVHVDPGAVLEWGEGNIDQNPLFVRTRDYHITVHSPCIDAGSDAEVYFDMDGEARPLGGGFDIGADEHPNPDCMDADADGYGDATCGGHDCDDDAPAVNPGVDEICDAIDRDCSGAPFDKDLDGDGHIDDDPACMGDDCDDGSPSVYPGAMELCDGLDTDCNGDILTGEVDHDGDGYVECEPWEGEVPGILGGGDCDEYDPAANPGVQEICGNGIDDDCDGYTDEGFDLDGDGFTICDEPVPDCDDDDRYTYPGADEICDGKDSDCDGAVPDDEDDGDGDGWRICEGDCDDTDDDVNPDEAEICHTEIDEDCDDVADEPDCIAGFTLYLYANYSEATLWMEFTIETPRPSIWATYCLYLTPSGIEGFPLWTVPLPEIDPLVVTTIGIPFPFLGPIGIVTLLKTAEGVQAHDFDLIIPGWPDD